MKRARLLWVVPVALCAVAVGAGIFRGTHPIGHTDEGRFVVPGEGRAFVDDAYSRGASMVRTPSGTVLAGIMPHHSLVAPLMAAFFSGLSRQTPPSTVVIIGPDHERRGQGYIVTTRHGWSTSYGTINANVEVVDQLVSSGLALIDDSTVGSEHGVYTVLPFIARQFPKARVVQLVVRADLRPDRLDEVATMLDHIIGPHDLVIASVDFSHYKNAAGAWSDDAVTLPVIGRMDADAALAIPVDSPPSISLLLRYAKLRGLSYQQLVHTNSAEYLHEMTLGSTTSYLTAYYSR